MNRVEFSRFPTKKLHNRLLASLTILGLSLISPAIQAAHPYERWADELGIDLNIAYDGIRVLEMQEGSVEATERRSPGRMYTEVHLGGMSSAILVREDLNKSYMLMPSMGFYREMSIEGGMTEAASSMEFSKIEKVGPETIIGHPSTKYKTRFKDKQGKGAGFIWVTDTGIPIKMDMIYSNGDVKGKHILLAFKELNIRAQDEAYFELPSDLKPMSISNMAAIAEAMARQGQGTTTAKPASSTPTTTPATPTTTASDVAAETGEEVVEAAKDEAQNSVIRETRSKISQGIRGLFNK